MLHCRTSSVPILSDTSRRPFGSLSERILILAGVILRVRIQGGKKHFSKEAEDFVME